MPTFVTNCLQAQPGRGAQGQLYLVPNVRNALAAGLARPIPIRGTGSFRTGPAPKETLDYPHGKRYNSKTIRFWKTHP